VDAAAQPDCAASSSRNFAESWGADVKGSVGAEDDVHRHHQKRPRDVEGAESAVISNRRPPALQIALPHASDAATDTAIVGGNPAEESASSRSGDDGEGDGSSDDGVPDIVMDSADEDE
jgi:hypothetical protein